MGTVFKAYVTRPLPEGAQIVTRDGKPVAVWIDASGKKHQARATSARAKRPGIVVRASTFSAQYKDGDGVVRRVATGCKTLSAAKAVLDKLEKHVEKVRGGIITQAEANVGEHADTPIVEHIEAYVTALTRKRGKGARRTVSRQHITNVVRTLRLAVDECGFRRLRDLRRDVVERWVQRLLDLPDEAVLDEAGNVTTPARPARRTINARLATLTAWGNWLVGAGRLASNPLARLQKLDEADDKRRQRRALTADELRRLLTVARLRPVAEHGRSTVRVVDANRAATSRATWRKAELNSDTIVAAAERGRGRLRPEVLARLERDGRERALLYAVLVTTGLRKGELAALTVGDVLLDEPQPVIVLPGADAKNGQRATLPLRADVAAELRAWIGEKAEVAGRQRVDLPNAKVASINAPLLYVPSGLIRILDRDLRAAGVPKRDDRGRTVDVHALRHTFATHLSAGGVAPRTAQAALRHSSLDLTMQHYTDPRLLDVAGALAVLPALPTAGSAPEAVRSPGAVGAVALDVALTSCRAVQNVALGCQGDERRDGDDAKRKSKKRRAAHVIPAKTEERATRLELATSSLGSRGPTVESAGNQGLSTPVDSRCTTGCTEKPSRTEVLARAVELVAAMRLPLEEAAAVLARLVANDAAPPARLAGPELETTRKGGSC